MTELGRGLRWGLGLLVAVGLLRTPGGAWGQALPTSPTLRTFGTASTITYTVPAESFGAYDSSFPDVYGASNATRFCAISGCILTTGVMLPAGALVSVIEVDGCDTSVTDDFVVRFLRAPIHNATPATLVTATSSGSPGCVFVTEPLTTPETIDNRDNLYILRFESPVPDNALAFQAVRITYQLQVTPAPAVAAFSDVPTSHPFFRFVEALAASGSRAGAAAATSARMRR